MHRRDEYRIIRDNDYAIELNGSTVVRKVCNKVGGFLRHPFQLTDFESIQPTEKKYLIGATLFIYNNYGCCRYSVCKYMLMCIF